MAKYTNEELLEAFGEMTLVELSEFVKAFEEKSYSPLLLVTSVIKYAVEFDITVPIAVSTSVISVICSEV